MVLCASNWVVVKDCEGSFDPYIFALLRSAPDLDAITMVTQNCYRELWMLDQASMHIDLRRFAVAAAAFSPFLKKALSSRKIWRGGLELGLWMGLGALLQAQPAAVLCVVSYLE